MKTYILEPSETELKNLTDKVSRKILLSLRDAYPDGLTTKELVEKTGEAESTVYSCKKNLEKENYIKEIDENKNKPGRPPSRVTDNRSSRYIIEDANYWNYSKDRFKLARGNVEYPTDFIKVSNRLLNEINLDDLHDRLLLFIKESHARLVNTDKEGYKAWAPNISKENLCPNCNINHEMRDFVRALLLRLVDRFETNNRYVEFLNQDENISNKEIQAYQAVHQERPLPKLEPQNKQVTTGSTFLRILSIDRDTTEDQFLFLAMNEDKKYFNGIIDKDLVTNDMIPDCLVECLTNNVEMDTHTGSYIALSKGMNDTIKVIPDNSKYPKLRNLTSKIESIFLQERFKNDTYIIEGFIVEDPKVVKIDKGSTQNQIFTRVTIRDRTGMIPLHLGPRYLNKFHKGDKILVVGAIEKEWHSLKIKDYGSVTKTGSIIITERNFAFRNDIFLKHLEFDSRLVQHDIIVTLLAVEFAKSDTIALLTVENATESKIYLHISECMAIQNRRRFASYVTGSAGPYKRIKDDIRPGIEEIGVIRFKDLDPTQPIASFLFRIIVGEKREKLDFTFTVQIPR